MRYRAKWNVVRYRSYKLDWDITGLLLSPVKSAPGLPTVAFINGGSANWYEFFVDVLKPIQDSNEMDLTLDEASSRVGLDSTTMAQALASYVRSILSDDSPYDRFINGDRGALGGNSGIQTSK